MISSFLPVLNHYSSVIDSELEERVHRLGIDTIDISKSNKDRCQRFSGATFRIKFPSLLPFYRKQ